MRQTCDTRVSRITVLRRKPKMGQMKVQATKHTLVEGALRTEKHTRQWEDGIDM